MFKTIKLFLLSFFLFSSHVYAACDAQTVLMAHFNEPDGSTTTVDSSSSAKTITVAGNAQTDNAQGKFSTNSSRGAAAGDYWTVGDSADWDFGTGDFTVDYWIRYSAVAANAEQFIVGDVLTTGKNVCINVGNTSQVQTRINNAERTVSFSWSNDTWYHVAIARSGSTIKLFIDGAEKDSWTNAADISGSAAGTTIGYSDRGGNSSIAWIDEFRVSKGIARWTGDFTPPTTQYCATSTAQFMEFCQ